MEAHTICQTYEKKKSYVSVHMKHVKTSSVQEWMNLFTAFTNDHLLYMDICCLHMQTQT